MKNQIHEIKLPQIIVTVWRSDSSAHRSASRGSVSPKAWQPESPVFAELPRAPKNASPVPELTSL